MKIQPGFEEIVPNDTGYLLCTFLLYSSEALFARIFFMYDPFIFYCVPWSMSDDKDPQDIFYVRSFSFFMYVPSPGALRAPG